MTHEKNTKDSDPISLGAFSYDRESGQLTDSKGKILRLRRQSADVLAVLAAEAGEVVGKEKLVATVWHGIATTDDSLVQCIADIRRSLGHGVVETFPKRGYRLRAGTKDTRLRPETRAGPRLWLVAAFVAAVVAAAPFVASRLAPSGEDGVIVPPAIAPERTLAVLPFVDLGGDPAQRFFSDGLSEDLTTALSRVPQLMVISDASSFDFRGAESGFRQIAQELGVRYLVRGAVRREAGRVRINVALVDPYGGFNLWADRFDWTGSDPFDVQDEVTRRIVEGLSLTLQPEEPPPQTVDPDAYAMLLRGLEPLRRRTAEGNAKARAFFERAAELQPGYARAYAYIAVTYGRETLFGFSDSVPRRSIESGLQAAVTAIQLDPRIPHAYFALGVLNLARGEYDNAQSAARHAIRLDANYADGYALLAEIDVQGGDLDEALGAIRRAKLLNPRYPFEYDWIEGHVLFQLGRYEEAQPFLEDAVALNPRFYRGLLALGANYGQQGNARAAREVLARALAIAPERDWEAEIARTSYRFPDRRERLAKGLRQAGLAVGPSSEGLGSDPPGVRR
jgi:TolB-like protein/DNA-binding winged helix-turn-helix (wHTH) protein/tetratricopeptide (TPR) repeat protein